MRPTPAENLYWNNYNRNDGRPGIVYILANDAFPHLLKIGQSTRSASARAQELNENCGTENPGRFSVLHEVRTADCGRAEKRVHKHLKKHRFRKEYFRIDAAAALEAVREACAFFDKQEDEKRVDEARKAAANVEQQLERSKLTPGDQAAFYSGLSHTEVPHQDTPTADATQQKQKPATPLPLKSSPAEPSANHTAAKKPQHSCLYAIAPCPSCRQKLRIPTNENLILTCPTCRYSFQRTPSGEIYNHNIGNLAPSKKSAPWWPYVIAVLAVGGGVFVLSGAARTGEVTAPAPEFPREEQRLRVDIQRYATNYQIPTPEPEGETELRAVEGAGKTIHFQYITTARGERALSKNLDRQYIQDGMRKIACTKPELRALMDRGAVVQYQLSQKSGATLTTTIACE